ncbi:retrotransposon hot spot (RHS) protein, putative, partial [Trypanosoma cruzi]
MPPKRNRVQGGNARSQASAVPQGGRQRRARPESEDVTDQPAATHIRVEEARQPQWTMCSTVEDILLKGRTLSTNMRLNDFLRNYVGGRAAVDEDHNVTMQVFVRRPNAYVQDQQLLRIICNLTVYQVYKLHHEGVYSLEQWRDYERKDMATPHVKGKLKGVLTQLLREGRHEAEERLRRAQEMKFTMFTNIEDVLFQGGVRVKDIKLNDFLLPEMEGSGIVDTNRDVSLEEFFNEPARYIPDAEVLKGMKTTVRYLKMGRAVMKEVDMEKDVRMLHKKGVDNLLKWSLAAEEVKANVHNLTKRFLDAAFIELMSSMTMSAPIRPEGFYESVYNARWHHVVEVPDGEGMGMYVREGEPQQPWTYKAVGDTLEKDDSVEEPGAPRLRLMVLTSDKGWPYSWEDES